MKKLLQTFLVGFILFSSGIALAQMTPEEAQAQYEAHNCSVAFPFWWKVCYTCDCQDDIDKSIYLQYGKFKDNLSDPQPTPIPEPKDEAECSAEDHYWYDNKCHIVPQPSTEPPFDGPTQGENGSLTILASEFETNTPSSTHAWQPIDGYMTAFPDDGVAHYVAELSVMLTYKVKFIKSGDHMLWVEGLFVTASSDSLHYGINGDRIGDMTFLNRTWSNKRQSADGFTIVNIPEPGIYIVNIWMREDGSKFKTIRFETDQTIVP